MLRTNQFISIILQTTVGIKSIFDVQSYTNYIFYCDIQYDMSHVILVIFNNEQFIT